MVGLTILAWSVSHGAALGTAADRDGKLSRDEYPQPAAFQSVDADDDGFATMEEVREYYLNRRNGGAARPSEVDP